MVTVRLSDKGEITIPPEIRREMGVEPGDELALEAREGEALLRPVRGRRDLFGVFHEYAHGKDDDWETVRRRAEEAVARQVANE